MSMTHVRKTILTTTILSVGIALASTAQAQTAGAEEEGIRDIVVTARKTSENLQTTPVAITALDTTALADRQIASVSQIAQATPSLSVQSGGTGNAGLIYLAIRGNAQNSPNSASDAAVGIYVDGVYYGRPMIGNMGLLDLATAEVLRGTQGTLFGRNTTGGALNMTTVQPDGELNGYVRASVGNYDYRQIEGAVTLPIQGDELSLRVAARYAERDGFGKNSIIGIKAAGVNHDISARATLRWAPESAPVTVTIGGDIIRTKDSYNNIALVGVNPAGGAAGLYASQNIYQYLQTKGDFYRNYANAATGNANVDDPYNHNRGEGVYGTIEYEVGDVTIKSITAFRHSNTGDQSDIDGTPVPVISYASDYVQRQFSEEFQVSGKTDNFDWIVGAFYFREKGTENSDSFPFQHTDLAGLANFFGPAYAGGAIAPSARNNSNFLATSKAIFAQVNYHVTDALRITGGLRYTWDTRDINRHGIQNITGVPENVIIPVAALGFPIRVVQPGTCSVGPNAGTVAGANCNNPVGAKFSYPAWVFGVDYELGDRKFIYAKTGGAAMAGGFNTRPTPVGFDSFDPEKVKDVEVGFKGDFLDRKLRTNIAGFYVWRNGAQNIVNQFSNGTLTQFAQNAGNVRSYGFEFEGTVLPWEGMEVTTAVSRLWSKYQSGSFTGISGVTGLVIDRSGEAVPQSPKWTFNMGATQTVPFEGGTFKANLTYAYSSKRNMGQDTPDLTYGTNPGNPADTAAKRIADYAAYNRLSTLKGYGLFNGRLGVELDNGIEFSIWGKNLTKTKYYTSLFNGYLSLGTAVQYQAAPRTLGATVGYKF